MRAAVYRRFGGPQVVRAENVPRPTPGTGDVLVRVVASTVSMADQRARSRIIPRGLGLLATAGVGAIRPLHEVGALLDAKAVHPGRSARSHLRTMAATHRIGSGRVDEVIELTGLAGVADNPALPVSSCREEPEKEAMPWRPTHSDMATCTTSRSQRSTLGRRPDGTRRRWLSDLQPNGALKVLSPIIVRIGRRQEVTNWASLKRYLEPMPTAGTAATSTAPT